MVKKKYFLLLSTLLLTVLLGLSGTCFATELNNSMVNNFIMNYYIYYYGTDGITEFNQWLNTTENQTYVDSWVERINRDNFYSSNRWLLAGTNGVVQLWYVNGTETQMEQHPPYVRNDRFTANVNNSYYVGWKRSLNIITKEWNNVASTAVNEQPLGANSNEEYEFFYTDMNLYYFYSSTPQTIRYPIGYESQQGILEDIYSNRFEYLPSALQSREIDLNGSYWVNETAQEILFAYNPFESGNPVNEADSVITGYIDQAHNFQYAYFSVYEYDYATNQFKYNGKYWESGDIGNIVDSMIWVEFKAKDYGTLLKPDTILHAEFVPKTQDFNNIHADFYIASPRTKIIDGVLQPRRNILTEITP